ncbi:hypothetical protein H1P_3520006 [Hyella patelloides LEGE 07179]|uniref:Uncharacterized protein n=1 Tax=Hyella patelloides LEGE 07179 TaxID=945734 RepID=A0A563VVY5_9CYAN|nr:hypothetical protein H1P_3520006 [Hyella patelloides LEGE 07179]
MEITTMVNINLPNKFVILHYFIELIGYRFLYYLRSYID